MIEPSSSAPRALPRTLLIVDDEEKICRVLAQYFSLKGYEVATVHGGEEALARVEASLPDAVLLDVFMPGLNGMETLKLLKQRYPHLRVVVVSAADRHEAERQALQLGADAYLCKPVVFGTLGEIVDRFWNPA